MLPREGAALGRYQFYNIFVFTNAGTYSCTVSRALANGQMVDLQSNCSHAWALDLVLDSNGLSPLESFEWLPVKDTGRREFVGVATGGGASEGYFESSQAPDLPLAPSLVLEEGKFAFTYRLFGSATDGTESHTSGFVGLDDDGRGVILGRDEPIGDTNWQIYETSDVTKLWSFPNGGPTMLAFARGNNASHLELATWDLGTDLRTIGGAVTADDHGLSGIDDLKAHSTWYYAANSFDDAGYRGLLGFAADTSASRALHLLELDNVRDAHSICAPGN